MLNYDDLYHGFSFLFFAFTVYETKHYGLLGSSLFFSRNYLIRLRTPVENSLRDAKLSFKDLDEVILVGGSTRIPAVQELVRKLTGKEPNVTVNPDEVVALGAAVQVGLRLNNLLLFFHLWLLNFQLEKSVMKLNSRFLR